MSVGGEGGGSGIPASSGTECGMMRAGLQTGWKVGGVEVTGSEIKPAAVEWLVRSLIGLDRPYS